jgi:hypothetical protein
MPEEEEETTDEVGNRIKRATVLITPDEHEAKDEVAAALQVLPDLYARGQRLVGVHTDETTKETSIYELPVPTVRTAISRSCRLLRESTDGSGAPTLLHVHPPEWLAPEVHARRHWPGTRPLRAVLTYPVLLPDGRVHDKPGYDEETGILYQPSFVPWEVPPEPTPAHIRLACYFLLYVVKDVPFEDAKVGWHVDETPEETFARLSRSPIAAAWASSVMTPFSRFAIPRDFVPLHAYNADNAGSGKDLLKTCTGEIVLGREMQFMPQNVERDDDAADRKRITALAVAGTTMCVVNNIRKAFGNGAIENAITTVVWGDRILGKSEAPRLPLILGWYATGNNIRLTGDMGRRCLMINLASPHAKPQERTDYTEQDLADYVRRNRAKIVWACLVLLRARALKGMDKLVDPGPCGFPGWSRLVRGAIMDVGLADPWLANGAADDSADDDESMKHEMFVNGWADALLELKIDEYTVKLGKLGISMSDLTRAVGQAPTTAKEFRDAAERAIHQKGKGPVDDNALAFPIMEATPAEMIEAMGEGSAQRKFKSLRAAIASTISGLRPGDLPNPMQLGAKINDFAGKPTRTKQSILGRCDGKRGRIYRVTAPVDAATAPAVANTQDNVIQIADRLAKQ